MSVDAAAAPVAPVAVEAPTPTDTPPPAPVEATAAPVPAPTTEPPEPEAKDFLELKRAKRAAFERDQKIKALAQEHEKLRSEYEPLNKAIERFEDDPLAALATIATRKGKTVQDVFDAMITAAAKHGDPPDPNDRVSKLERQLAEKEAAAAKEREEAQQRAAEEAERRMIADVSHRIGQFIQADPERYERLLARGEKTYNDLIRLGNEWYDKFNENISVDKAADILEAQYQAEDEQELERLKKSRKLSKHFAPPVEQTPPAAPAPTPTNEEAKPAPSGDTTKSPQPLRTITNRQAAVPAGVRRVIRKPSSEREVIERAAALMPARYQPR